MRLHFYIASQLLFAAAICCLLWFVFIDWSKVTWFELIVAIGCGVAFINLLYFLISGIIYGKEVSRQIISFALPKKKTIDFSTDSYMAGKFLIFCRNANLRNLIGSIVLLDGRGKAVERLLLNSKDDSGDNSSEATKTVRISRGGKSATLDMLRTLTLPTIDRNCRIAQVQLDLDWHPHARDSRSKLIDFEIIFRGRKSSPKNLAITPRVLLN